MLTTGRLYAHWHTLTRTAKCEKLVRRDPGPYAELHPDDAARLGVARSTVYRMMRRHGHRRRRP